MPDTKICTKCEKEFPATLEYFNKHKKCKYGLNSTCKDCEKKYKKQYYENNKKEIIKKVEKYFQTNKETRQKYLKQWQKENPLCGTWQQMIERCYNPNHISFKNYGARGVKVCERWLNKETGYKAFVSDIGDRPEGMTLDRIDNDGDYTPANCKWSTWKEQHANKRKGG